MSRRTFRESVIEVPEMGWARPAAVAQTYLSRPPRNATRGQDERPPRQMGVSVPCSERRCNRRDSPSDRRAACSWQLRPPLCWHRLARLRHRNAPAGQNDGPYDQPLPLDLRHEREFLDSGHRRHQRRRCAGDRRRGHGWHRGGVRVERHDALVNPRRECRNPRLADPDGCGR